MGLANQTWSYHMGVRNDNKDKIVNLSIGKNVILYLIYIYICYDLLIFQKLTHETVFT